MAQDKYYEAAAAARRAEAQKRSCGRKKTYATRELALVDIPEHQQSYECRHCGKWHRATDPPTKLKRKIRSIRRRR